MVNSCNLKKLNLKSIAMKKVFVALTLMMFVGSVSASVYSTSTGNSTEISKKDDDKKEKRKKKAKKGEKKACCTKTEGEKKCCSSEKK
jgi:hypothetical protein